MPSDGGLSVLHLATAHEVFFEQQVSTLEAVLSAVTLSEENGRVTVFEDGEYVDRRRDELADRWSSRDETHAADGDG